MVIWLFVSVLSRLVLMRCVLCVMLMMYVLGVSCVNVCDDRMLLVLCVFGSRLMSIFVLLMYVLNVLLLVKVVMLLSCFVLWL